MADLSDVETAIVNLVGSAIYPNGAAQPSALPGATPVKIGRGWPLPATLDADLAAGSAQITVYPLSGSYSPTYQILDATYVITPAVHGMTFSLSGNVITVSGQPTSGEYLTLVCDNAHIYSRTGATTAAILSALATDAQANYPSASATATTLTVPVQAYLTVRQGAPATLGKVIHRQRHSIMVSVWAPTAAIRDAASSTLDIALKGNLKLTMPDSSQALMIYSRSIVTDETQKAAIYRRSLIYDVEYATVQQFTGYEITSVQTSSTSPINTNAIT
jgi:hypothetical protein